MHTLSVMSTSLPASSVHGISQQEYWTGLPFSPPGDLPDPGSQPKSPALADGFFTTSATWKAQKYTYRRKKKLEVCIYLGGGIMGDFYSLYFALLYHLIFLLLHVMSVIKKLESIYSLKKENGHVYTFLLQQSNFLIFA